LPCTKDKGNQGLFIEHHQVASKDQVHKEMSPPKSGPRASIRAFLQTEAVRLVE